MRLQYHGGNCCGCNHISGFEVMPDTMLYPVAPQNQYVMTAGANNVLYKEYKEEPAKDRLASLIKACKDDRTSGMIEVILAGYFDDDEADEYEMVMNDVWGPILLEHGFQKDPVTFFNSNTDNRVHRYYLLTGQDMYEDADPSCNTYEPYYEDDNYDYCYDPDPVEMSEE